MKTKLGTVFVLDGPLRQVSVGFKLASRRARHVEQVGLPLCLQVVERQQMAPGCSSAGTGSMMSVDTFLTETSSHDDVWTHKTR